MAPFGFVDDGLGEEIEVVDGDVWQTDNTGGVMDEYGDRSYMWEYLS